MGSLSRNKGARGEREAAGLLDPHVDYGTVKRTAALRGGRQLGLDLGVETEDGDVDSLLNGWAVEVKRYADWPSPGQWQKWVDGVVEDAPSRARGHVVLFRKDRSPQWWAAGPWKDSFVLTPYEAWVGEFRKYVE